MTYVAFEPHLDDTCLFFCYGLLLHRPHVVTVFGNAQVQMPDVTCEERVMEQGRAFAMLGGFEWTMWLFPDTSLDTPQLREAIRACMVPLAEDYAGCFAPLPEPGGHQQHNIVGECAREVFGDRARFYATYQRGNTRTRLGTEVLPQPGEAAMKYAAMGCYSSQINREDCRPWFAAADCLREWTQ